MKNTRNRVSPGLWAYVSYQGETIVGYIGGTCGRQPFVDPVPKANWYGISCMYMYIHIYVSSG